MLEKEISKERSSFWMEYATNLLIASIPACIAIVLLKEFAGIFGALLSSLLIFGGGVIVGNIRKRMGKMTKKKTVIFWLLVNIAVFMILPLLIIGLFVDTQSNQQSSSSEYRNNIYKNAEYGFVVTFPDDWRVMPGDESDSESVVQKATRGGVTISIAIKETPVELKSLIAEDQTVRDLYDIQEFAQQAESDLKKVLPESSNFEFGEVVISQLPAYWSKFTDRDAPEESTFLMYQLIYKNNVYMINIQSPSETFESNKLVFDRTVDSFSFENEDER